MRRLPIRALALSTLMLISACDVSTDATTPASSTSQMSTQGSGGALEQ